MSAALIAFIKNPEKGKVKTRLAKTVGDDRALAIYKALLTHTRKLCEAFQGNRYVFYKDFINKDDAWTEPTFENYLQRKGDLGVKMQYAFETVLEENQKAVIIGSDCASLTSEIIEDAFLALDTTDFVLGPALDGGYYLLGMRTFEPMVFDSIEWSTAKVLSETVLRIQSLNKTYTLLPALSDIDHESDWEEWGWDI